MNTTRHNGILCTALAILFFSGAGLAVPTLPPDLPKNPGDAAIRKALAAILADIAKQHDALVKIQRELVRRPGIAPENGGDGEEDKARWIEEWLAAEGLSPPERVDCPDSRVRSGIRPNLILRQPNPFADRPTLWVIAYLDNSPPGDIEAWLASPLSLRVDGDSMFGLGVQDNNNAIAAALLLVRSLHKQQAVPLLNLGVLFMSGEKTGSRFGFLHLIEKRPHLFNKSDYFLALSYGSEQGDLIEIGEKGILWLKVSVRGKAGHSALPETGKNALAAGADMIASLPRLLERFPATDSLFEQPTCTFTPTRPIAVESTPNQIPAFFGFNIDARILPNYQPEEVQTAVEEMAGDIAKKYALDVGVEQVMLLRQAPITSREAPVVRSLSRAIDEQLGREARYCGIGGGSIAGELRRRGYPTAVWRMAPFREHSANESMSITSNLIEAAMMARLLFDPELAAPTLVEEGNPGLQPGQSK